MYANGEPPGSRVDVVAGERFLRLAVELPAGIKRQRVRRDRDALPQEPEHVWREVRPVQASARHRRLPPWSDPDRRAGLRLVALGGRACAAWPSSAELRPCQGKNAGGVAEPSRRF